MDRKIISLCKAISWRLVASSTSWTIVYLMTKDYTFSTAFSVTDFVLKIILFYGHERCWEFLKSHSRGISSMRQGT